jgi:hypothetical protein
MQQSTHSATIEATYPFESTINPTTDAATRNETDKRWKEGEWRHGAMTKKLLRKK